MDFNDLYYFYLVAEHSGYTSAEKMSGVTKSLLSRRIAQLEDKMKVRLVQRNSRSFALTAAGRILHEHAINMVREGVNAYESVSELVSEPSGVVRMSCPTVLAQYHLAPIIPGFMARYPNVRISVDATDRNVQIIDEGFDFALRARRTVDDEPNMIARTLAVSRMLLVASPGFLKHHGLPEHPSQLIEIPTVSSVLDRNENEQRWDFTHRNGEVFHLKHRSSIFCTNPQVQFEAATHGIGIALIPDTIAGDGLKNGSLHHLLQDWNTESHVIHAVYPSRKHMNPAVRAFLDYLILHLPGTMYP